MQVSNPNNVKIYNLTAGKSLPDWLSEKKKRALLKKDVEVSRRIELIQDFDMPGVSSCIGLSPNRQYVVVTGMYKPTMKCFDLSELSLKFERCFDNEVVKFTFLSDDFSKIIFLQQDRYIELHTQGGRYFRLRVPKYNRDMAYHKESCDLYIACAGSEMYRLNLERGCFLSPLQTEGTCVNVCKINPVHQLLLAGTQEGKIEAWDPRSRTKCGILDCASGALEANPEMESVPSVTAMELNGGLQVGVGLSTGQVLLYDIRSDKPLLVKDHYNELPIKDIRFHSGMDLVISMDSKVVKLWEKESGKPYTSISSDKQLNNICSVPDTGLLFIANEAQKVQTYYIPSIGPAPKWCNFLDNLTEELEESDVTAIYDNYKFVTRQELDDLGLTHLLGTNLLRAYMHGFFVDIRLYKKAKSVADPFAFEEYRKKKIKEKLDATRDNRVKLAKLPSVNKDIALKLMHGAKSSNAKKRKTTQGLLEDDRFKAMFENPDFTVDRESDTFKLLNPVLSSMEEQRAAKAERRQRLAEERRRQEEEQRQEELEPEGRPSSEEDDDDDEEEDSSDGEGYVTERQRRQQQRQLDRRQRPAELVPNPAAMSVKVLQGDSVREITGGDRRERRAPLGDRLKRHQSDGTVQHVAGFGNRQMSFAVGGKKKRDSRRREEALLHHAERRKIRRSASSLGKTAGGFKNT